MKTLAVLHQNCSSYRKMALRRSWKEALLFIKAGLSPVRKKCSRKFVSSLAERKLTKLRITIAKNWLNRYKFQLFSFSHVALTVPQTSLGRGWRLSKDSLNQQVPTGGGRYTGGLRHLGHL